MFVVILLSSHTQIKICKYSCRHLKNLHFNDSTSLNVNIKTINNGLTCGNPILLERVVVVYFYGKRG